MWGMQYSSGVLKIPHGKDILMESDQICRYQKAVISLSSMFETHKRADPQILDLDLWAYGLFKVNCKGIGTTQGQSCEPPC